MGCHKSRHSKTLKTNIVSERLYDLTCIVPETTPVQKSPVLVVVNLQEGFLLVVLKAGGKQGGKNIYVTGKQYN